MKSRVILTNLQYSCKNLECCYMAIQTSVAATSRSSGSSGSTPSKPQRGSSRPCWRPSAPRNCKCWRSWEEPRWCRVIYRFLKPQVLLGMTTPSYFIIIFPKKGLKAAEGEFSDSRGSSTLAKAGSSCAG